MSRAREDPELARAFADWGIDPNRHTHALFFDPIWTTDGHRDDRGVYRSALEAIEAEAEGLDRWRAGEVARRERDRQAGEGRDRFGWEGRRPTAPSTGQDGPAEEPSPEPDRPKPQAPGSGWDGPGGP